MAVDYAIFLDWAKDRFGEENIKVKHTAHGDEILTHSFYAHRKGMEDFTHNLWMNPSGGKGKKKAEFGSFRCWKTDTMGTLVKLVSDYDSIPYEEAEELLCGSTTLRQLELRVHEFFNSDPEPVQAVEEAGDRLQFPPFTSEIDKMWKGNTWKFKAQQYLAARKLPTKGMHVCTDGEYKCRIIIPYYDQAGNLIWYNARLMYDKKGVIKYMKCKAVGSVTQDDVLYMTDWPPAGSKIYLMEGEFDAISMSMAGFYACALGGKSISDAQIQMIRKYIPVLAFDADDKTFKEDSGLQATINVGIKLLDNGFPCVHYVRPPKAYKDWNKLLVERDAKIVKMYVEKYEKPFTPDTPNFLLSNIL